MACSPFCRSRFELGDAWASGSTYDIGQGLLLALPTFLIAVGMHYGLWRPAGASEAVQRVGDTAH